VSYFRDNIDAMDAYVPGEQKAGRKIVKLNTNENPYPPSPEVLDVLRSLVCDTLRVYPDPNARHFLEAVSNTLEIPESMLLAGNGSDNLIMMIARAAAGPGRRIVTLDPTFPFYRTQCEVEGAELIEVPFEADYGFPLDGLLAAKGHVTFIANPNSPTGTIATPAQLEALAEGLLGVGLVVIDEAYADFAEFNALDLPGRFENVIILRTLSKGYSLAGLRLGYAVAAEPVIRQLWKAREIYTVSVIANHVGAEAIRDQTHMTANAEKIKASRQALKIQLESLGWTVVPSAANFLLAGPDDGQAEAVCNALKGRGIFVRYFKHPALADRMRITVGTDEQNAALVAALKEITGA
jgi:histidinol-phosphate aminotransferase